MHKIFFIVLIIGLLLVLSSSIVFTQGTNQAESLTITTYYPSPYGVYKTLRLFPNQDVAIGQACTNAGEMTYDPGTNSPLYCDGSNWTQVGDFGTQIIGNFTKNGDFASIPNKTWKEVPDWYADSVLTRDSIDSNHLRISAVGLGTRAYLISWHGQIAIDAKTSDDPDARFVKVVLQTRAKFSSSSDYPSTWTYVADTGELTDLDSLTYDGTGEISGGKSKDGIFTTHEIDMVSSVTTGKMEWGREFRLRVYRTGGTESAAKIINGFKVEVSK